MHSMFGDSEDACDILGREVVSIVEWCKWVGFIFPHKGMCLHVNFSPLLGEGALALCFRFFFNLFCTFSVKLLSRAWVPIFHRQIPFSLSSWCMSMLKLRWLHSVRGLRTALYPGEKKKHREMTGEFTLPYYTTNTHPQLSLLSKGCIHILKLGSEPFSSNAYGVLKQL